MTKECTSCKQHKELTDFYQYKRMTKKKGIVFYYQPTCRVCRISETGDYFNRNKEKMRAAQKAWRIKNREKMKDWHNLNYKKRAYKEFTEEVKIALNHRTKLKSIIKRTRLGKIKYSWNKIKHLGCTGPELISHIESQFKEGMSWDNWGMYGWHIDHIEPLCSFNLLDKSQQRIAFHYTNLQPLWAQENREKGRQTKKATVHTAQAAN